MGGFPALPSPNNPYVGAASSAAVGAGSAYAAGLQFATALRAAAAQQQQHQQQSLKDQFETELKLRKDGYTPYYAPGESDSSGLKRRSVNPAAELDPSSVIQDHFGRKWVAPQPEPPKPDATPEQGYNGLMKALQEGGQVVSPEGNVHQMTTTPRFQMGEDGSLASTGTSGVNVPVPDQGRVVTPPGGDRSLYMPTGEEKAATTLQEHMAQENAKQGTPHLDTSSFIDTNTGIPTAMMIDTKTGQATPVKLPAGFQHVEKPEKPDKYTYTAETDDKGTVRTKRILNGDENAAPEFWNGKTKKWEADSGDNHFGKSKTEPFVIPGLGGASGSAGPGAQLTGDEFLKSLPAGTAAQVKAMAEGRLSIPSASRSPAAIQLRSAVLQYDPSYSDQRAQVRKAFISGPEGTNLGKINTAIVHLGRLGDVAEALQNGSFTPGNELYNWARDKFGSAKVTNLGLLRDAVNGEMAAALKGNATDIEIEKLGKSMRLANSPDQWRGVVQEGMAILNDKANTADERYHAILPDDPWSPILPSAKAQLQKHGVKRTGPGGAPAAGGGQAYIVGRTYAGGLTYLGGDPNNAASWKKK